MTDREIADCAIVAVAAYLHPDYCIGDRDGKVVRVEDDAAIRAGDAAHLATWLWSKHAALAGGIETAIFDAMARKAA